MKNIEYSMYQICRALWGFFSQELKRNSFIRFGYLENSSLLSACDDIWVVYLKDSGSTSPFFKESVQNQLSQLIGRNVKIKYLVEDRTEEEQ